MCPPPPIPPPSTPPHTRCPHPAVCGQDAPYILHFSDADEIPHPALLARTVGNRVAEYNSINALSGGDGYLHLEQKLYVYGLKLVSCQPWYRAVVTTDRLAGTLWHPPQAHGHVNSLSNLRVMVRDTACMLRATPGLWTVDVVLVRPLPSCSPGAHGPLFPHVPPSLPPYHPLVAPHPLMRACAPSS
jgi:hypothetical protein